LTGYSVLGLLCLRDLTAYELAQQMRRSMRFASPRADSVVYNEPKRLTRMGLVTARDEERGRRTVAVYSITDEGRRVFRRWLGEPSEFPELESEALVKAIFADQGDVDDLLATLHQLQQQCRVFSQRLAAQGRDYLETGGPYPDRLHVIAVSGRFANGFFRFLHDWATQAEAEVRSWPSSKRARREWALQRFEAMLDDALPPPDDVSEQSA
jgi:DNA-binding PadR family transcriptional regulator